MLAFSEILKSFSPIKNIKGNITSVRKFIFEKFFDLVLIVISIYIALNVEKIAEHGNDREKLKQYYENIEKEILKDISSLDTCRVSTDLRIADERRLLKMLTKYSPQYKDSVDAYMAKAVSLQLFSNSEMLSYKSMVMSGDVKLIKNLKIKEQFIALEGKYNEIKMYEDYTLEYVKKEIVPLINQNFSLLENTKLMNSKLYEDFRFKNQMVFFYSLNITRKTAYEAALVTARETHKILKQELGKM